MTAPGSTPSLAPDPRLAPIVASTQAASTARADPDAAVREFPPNSTVLRAAHSTVAADDIARAVETHWPVGRVESCVLARRGFNDVYELKLADGRRLAARLGAIRARGEANVEYETALMSHLKQAGAGVAAPLTTNYRTRWVPLPAAEGVRMLVVFEFLHGEGPGDSLPDIEATGKGLAKLHAASESYTGPTSGYQLDLHHLLQRPLKWLSAAPTLDDDLRSAFTAMAERVGARIDAMPELLQVICHGDCHGGNNFMTDAEDGSRIASFFDFDDAGPGFLSYDLAVYLWVLCQGKPKPDEAGLERWSRYIAGYRSVRAIPDADYDAIAAFVPVRHFWLLGEYASRGHHWGVQALPRDWLRKQLGLMESWESLKTPPA